MQDSEEGTPQGGPLSPLLAQHLSARAGRRLPEERGLWRSAFGLPPMTAAFTVGSERAAEPGVGPDEPMDRPGTEAGSQREEERNRKAGGDARFLGFRVSATGKIEVAPTSLEQFQRSKSGSCGTAARSPDERRAPRPLVRLCPGLVGILPPGRVALTWSSDWSNGFADTFAHALLGSLARPARTPATPPGLGHPGPGVENGAQFAGRLAGVTRPQRPSRLEQRDTSEI